MMDKIQLLENVVMMERNFTTKAIKTLHLRSSGESEKRQKRGDDEMPPNFRHPRRA
jgi:hypothetical protein